MYLHRVVVFKITFLLMVTLLLSFLTLSLWAFSPFLKIRLAVRLFIFVNFFNESAF